MPTRATRVQSGATGSESAVQIHADLQTLAEAAATVADSSSGPESSPIGAVRTRSGRVSMAPVRYEPVEQVEDDYAADDYDSDESEVSSVASSDDDEEEDESDADEDGNLDGFVVPDKSETSDSESDGEPPVSVQKRRAVAVKKRPAPTAPSARE